MFSGDLWFSYKFTSWEDKIRFSFSSGELKKIISDVGVNYVDYTGLTIIHHINQIRWPEVIDHIFDCKPRLVSSNGKVRWPVDIHRSDCYSIQKLLEYDEEGVYADEMFIERLHRKKAGYEVKIMMLEFMQDEDPERQARLAYDMSNNDFNIMIFENHKKKRFTFFRIMLPRLLGNIHVDKKYRFY